MKTSQWLLAVFCVFPLLLGAADKEARDVAAVQDQGGPVVVAPSEQGMAAGAQRVLRTRAMQTAVERMLDGAPTTAREPAVPPQHRRARVNENAVLSRMHQSRPQPQGLDAFRATRLIRPAPHHATRTAKLSSPTDITAIVDGSLEFLINGEDTTAYVAGDTIVLTVSGMGSDTVWIEPYIDDGDSIFDPASDFWLGQEQEEIFIRDGDYDDETPAGDGVWQISFDTGEMSEEGPGPFFGIQGAMIFIYGYTSDFAGGLEGFAMADILPPESTTGVSGFVGIDEGPAPNMIVVAFPMSFMTEDSDGPEFGFITKTDLDGNYVIGIPDTMSGMNYVIMAVDIFGLYPGHYPDPMMYDNLYIGVGSQLDGIDFTLIEGNSSIRVTLTEFEGGGIPDIGVEVNNGPYTMWDTTDANGVAEFQVISGWWWIDFNEEDLLGAYMIPETEGVDVGEFDFVEVSYETYPTDASISGTATLPDGVTGVEGVEVHGGTWGYYSWTQTGPDGTYQLPVSTYLNTNIVAWEDGGVDTMYGYWVDAWMEGAFLIQPQHYDRVMAGDEGIDFTIYEADAGMSGFVFDADSMNPLRDAEIRAYTMPDTGMDFGMFEVWFWTDDNGYYELPMLGGYLWNIEVYYPDEWWYPAAMDTVYLYSGQYIERDFYISPPADNGFVEGYVYDTYGNGIFDAYVEMWGPRYYETWTDENGYFAFHEVPFGWYTVSVTVADQPPQFQDINVGPDPVYLEFWMGAFDIFVNGTVRDDAEAPIGNALVYAWSEFGGMYMTMTDTLGYYELFLPPDWFDFRAGAPGFFAQDMFGVDVQKDTTIDFMLAPAGGALNATAYGNVVGEMGYPVRNVFSLWETDDYLAYTFTNSDGYYQLPLVGDRDYELMFRKQGFMEHHDSIHIPAGDTEYSLTLHPEAFMKIISVTDVGPDHGGKLAVEWGVNQMIHGEIKYFTVWQIGLPDNPDYGSMTDVSGIILTHQGEASYRKVVATETDYAEHYYTVIAYDYGDWPRWFSDVWSGFSTDDLAPMVPEGLIVSGSALPGEVILSWEPSIDDPVAQTPVQYYTVYRAPAGGELAPLEQVTGTEFVDHLDAIGTYNYAVSATDFGGNESLTSAPEPFTYVSVEAGAEIPEVYALGANYPNPFNPSSTIPYQLPENGFVTLKVYDLTGKLVTTLVSEQMPAGYHQVVWNGKDNHGTSVATGVYFYRIEAGDAFVQTRKMILMK